MRRFLMLIVILLAPLSLHAQTAAQRALMNEPEIRQINATTRDLQRTQDDPDARGTWLHMAGLSVADLRAAQALLDRLEDRLNNETQLSELIRERVRLQEMTASILGPGSQSVQQLAGVLPTTSRWTDMRAGLADGSNAIRAYCPILNNANDACKGDGPAMRLAGGHENAWAKCFNQHNWVERSSERNAYESCLTQTDPIAKLCADARKASPQAPACPAFTVNYADVNQLRFYHDRFSTDPAHLPATATIVGNQPAHFTTLEALVTPAMPSYAGFKTTIRARLDTPIEGQYAPGLNPSTANVGTLDSRASAGLGGSIMLIPAGTEFKIEATFNGPNMQRGDGGNLNLQIVNLRTGPGMLSTQSLVRKIPWPQDGSVLLAANSPITLPTACGCPYVMSVADFRQRAAEYTAAKAATPARKYGAIIVGTRIQTVLLDTIDSAGVVAGRRFHAQLSADSDLLPGFKRDDAITLPKGTDVYLKVTDVDGKPYTGEKAPRLTIDYLILNGQKIVVKTVGANLTGPIRLTPAAPTGRRAGPPPAPVEAAGAKKGFTVAEQVDVNIEGMALSAAAPASGAQTVAAATTPLANPAPSAARPTPPARAGAVKSAADPPPAAPPANTGRAAGPGGDVRSVADFGASWLARNVAARGTIARVEQSGPWELLYFKESSEFVACFVAAAFRAPTSAVAQADGADFSKLVGNTVEMRGPVAQRLCAGKAGMRINTPNQIQVSR